MVVPALSRPVVHRHEEAVVVALHRGDQRRPAERPDLDIVLARLEAARRDVQQREVVRFREAGNVLENRVEARNVLELLGQLTQEPVDVRHYAEA